MKVGTIKEIWRYPAKSMFGEQVTSAQIQARGFADDRCWAVRDELSGEFVGGRKYPKLMQLKARYLEEPAKSFGPAAQPKLEIEFPDGRVVNSDDPYMSAILSMFVGHRVSLCSRPAANDKKPHRLNKPMSPSEIRYALGMKPDDPDPDFSAWSVKVLATLAKYTTPPGALYDVYPLHFMTTGSLETMRGHYPEGDFRPERYRPNFVIETDPALSGLVENDWRGMDLQIGDALIRCNMPTIRCSMPGAAQPGMEKDPKIPLAVMQHAGQHLGAYATPRNQARIQVGDEVTLLPRSSGRVYIWFDDLLRRLKSRSIALSNRVNDWQEQRTKAAAATQPMAHPKGFVPFKVVQRQQESEDIVSFVFSDPARDYLPRFVPGQHVVLAIPQFEGKYIYRPYSLSAAAGDGSRYRISVKRETVVEAGQSRVGVGSGWLHEHLTVGDSIAIKEPAGQFADVPTDATPLVLISAGIGITPYMAMLQAIAAENPQRFVTLLHGIRRLQDFAFADELVAVQNQLPNFQLKLFVSQPEDEALPDFAQAGRMDIQAELGELSTQDDTSFFLCGNPAFTTQMRDALLAANIPQAQINMESFGLSQVVDHSDNTPYEINCVQSQRRLNWDPQQDNLLSFVEEQGLEVSSGCRYGACQACEVTLLTGEVQYPPEIQPPAGKNKVLLCSARPKSKLELEL